MLFTLEPLPAAEGDCLLLHWGTAEKPKIALIDGGPGRVYEEDLRPRLDEIVANLGVDQLTLELVMVSHMDNDHVVGIKKLMSALKKQVANNAPVADRTIRVRRLWHNVFNDILGDAIDDYYKTLTASVQASVAGQPNPKLVDDLKEAFKELHGENDDEAAEDAQDIAAVLAGHGEGRDVRNDHQFLFDQNQIAALNSPFKDKKGKPTLITLEMTPKPEDIGDLKFTIAGPMREQIEALQVEFDKYIKKNGLTVEAVLAAYADDSIKNLSSIVTLVEFEGKRILLTGDARGDYLLKGLKKQKLLDGNGQLVVDIFKVPHHGSARNADLDLFQTVVADVYVLSGDGKHGNPDRETIEMILEARGKKAKFDLVLTYDIDHIDPIRKADFDKKQKKKAVPKKWNAKNQSLAALFKKTDAEGYSFTLTTGAPVTIDLGDEKVEY